MDTQSLLSLHDAATAAGLTYQQIRNGIKTGTLAVVRRKPYLIDPLILAAWTPTPAGRRHQAPTARVRRAGSTWLHLRPSAAAEKLGESAAYVYYARRRCREYDANCVVNGRKEKKPEKEK